MTRNFLPGSKKRIAVAMSGGVDSSVAAYLMAKAGHEIVGLTAWTLNGPGKCCNDALVNAGRVCEMLGVPYDTVDLRAEFSHFVMDYYNNSYEAGLTPNPCVECNRYVKWEMLVRYAVEELGVDYVATGHYAILEPAAHGVNVFRSVDEHKDQTYMMARVYPKDLAKTLFPLGEMTKPEVVALARELDLPTAYSKESQDICFVLNGQHNYMDLTLGKRKGNFVDTDTGKVLGEHDGYYRFTLGQRKGIGVAAGRPIYVTKIDPHTNTVYLGDAHHLESTTFKVLAPNWLLPELEAPGAFPLDCMVKIRYNSPPVMGRVELLDEASLSLKVTLFEPQSAITPGQIAAFYDGEFRQLLGGGYIERYLSHEAFSETKRDNLPDLYCQVAPATA
ncbi:tRNA 2-thiouridine(34) synthase MnmA [Vampirovibrio sp.]|uniref:tRNA 2-thiouridine(34) synthase MnmA n=1 Tax=Vampirovibrio sp. TaxID=2717857 RepID=UPI003594919B